MRSKWLNSKIVTQVDKETLKTFNAQLIKESFGKSLVFGTSGIRTTMGLGSSKLNVYTIKLIAYAWVMFLEKNYKSILKKGFVVGHDTRNNGTSFAWEVAQVISGKGYNAYLFPNNKPVPTPLISYTIIKKKLGGGACLTASHNPPKYNGFKVFNHFGGHLMPIDTEKIQEELKKIDVNTFVPSSPTNIKYISKLFFNEYLNDIKKTIKIDHSLSQEVKVVFSPQHGASYLLGPQILKETGFQVHKVKYQSIPDGNFPHTPDPNPENKDSFQEMILLGKKINAEILLTTDPDGDRVAVGVKKDENYYLLNGHEAGALLTYYLLQKFSLKDSIMKNSSYIIKTVVTTSLIKKIANSFNVKVLETLTGYKFIGELTRTKSQKPLFSLEESYGASLCPNLSLDKDAIQVLPVFAEMTAYYKRQNKTLVDVLSEIYKKWGYYIHYNAKQKFKEIHNQNKLLAFLDKLTKLTHFGEFKIKEIQNFQRGWNNHSPTNLIKLIFENDSWIAIRPSGTEPLIRKYFCLWNSSKKEVDIFHVKIKNFFDKLTKDL